MLDLEAHRMYLLSLVGLVTMAAGCPAESDDEDAMAGTTGGSSGTSGDTETTAASTTGSETTTTRGDAETTAADGTTTSGGDTDCPEQPKVASPCDALEAKLIECGWSEDDAYTELIVCADDTYYDADASALYACISLLDCAEIGEVGLDPNGRCDCYEPF